MYKQLLFHLDDPQIFEKGLVRIGPYWTKISVLVHLSINIFHSKLSYLTVLQTVVVEVLLVVTLFEALSLRLSVGNVESPLRLSLGNVESPLRLSGGFVTRFIELPSGKVESPLPDGVFWFGPWSDVSWISSSFGLNKMTKEWDLKKLESSKNVIKRSLCYSRKSIFSSLWVKLGNII